MVVYIQIYAGLSEDAVKMLVKERHIVGIGLDTASVDPGSSKVSIIHFTSKVFLLSRIILNLTSMIRNYCFSLQTFPAHVLLAKEQIFSLENVANLRTLITDTEGTCSLRLFVLPLNIVGGTGAPTRILAYCK